MRRTVTFCLNYPIVLARSCENSCGYCRFPISEPGRLPTLKAVRRHLREAAHRGATQVELVAGEGISNDPKILEAVRYYGFDSYVSYLTRILQVIEATNRKSHLFSLMNIGPLSLAELRLMRPYLCAFRVMLESADPELEFREAHRDAPSKLPYKRLESILIAGKVGIPLTTGILVGIGESVASRKQAFEIIAKAHELYGHIQAVRVQMFHPIPGTSMEDYPEVDEEEFLETVADARHILGPGVHVQVAADEHPHLIGRLLDAGVDDFGEISVRRAPRDNLTLSDLVGMMESEAAARRMSLARRFPIHAAYCTERWYPGGFPKRIPAALAVRCEQAERV